MDFKQLLLSKTCSCGMEHTCKIKHVEIGHNALERLPALLASYQHILLVADENTYAAAGKQVEAALCGIRFTSVVFDGTTVLIPNETAVERVQRQLPGHDLIVGIGSGVIQDLCKYVSFYSGIPYFVVATAPSMDGYASTGAAMIMNGMKITYSCSVPDVILADTDILKNAPMEMIQAGYGDIVGKYSALNDWKLSHVVNGEYFCQRIYDMTMDALVRTLAVADGLIQRDENSIKILMEALIFVGIAMSFAGSSRPASGSEHHLSHFYEIVGITRNEPYFPHGIDVAYSTVITAALREEILKHPFPHRPAPHDRKEYEIQMQRVYGPVSDGCIALQHQAGSYHKNRHTVYLEKESEIRNILSQMPASVEIEGLLNAVGLKMDEFYQLYDPQKIADSVSFAKDLKDRYTVLWLYYDLFGIRK